MDKQILSEQIQTLITTSNDNITEWLKYIVKQDGGKKTLSQNIKIYEIHNFQGFSGYNYWIDDVMVGQLHMATLQACGFVVYRRLFINNQVTESYEYYGQEGQSKFTQESLDGGVIFYNSINMDPTNPMVNHLYNIINSEYDQTSSGFSRVRLIQTIEKVLQSLYKSPELFISANGSAKDMALRNIYCEIHRTEIEPVLTWDERQAIYRNLKSIRSKIIRTKKRVHGYIAVVYYLQVLWQDFIERLKLFKKRPYSNFKGMLYQFTIGNLLWFFRTVKSNLGLSIAMAIYTPFTFYFITQPMNPHAMQVVGQVRSVFLNTTKEIQSWFDIPKVSNQVIKESIAEVKDLKKIEDTVNTSQASQQQQQQSYTLPSNQIHSWEQRMSHFKAMQINYESNLIFASRMGRIEQMENQFAFPLTAEASWNEIQYYENEVSAAVKFNPELDSDYRDFLVSELARVKKLKVYIWHKMAQFFLDHPYIVVDQEDEQTTKDYYTGRSFVFMKKMTKELLKSNSDLAPITQQKVMELANKFESKKVNGISIIDTLKKNSIVYSNNNTYDSDALRKKINRHWEILFIQQNKKQEASSFGLQLYTWSIRNALWCLQTIYSAKREELNNLTYKYNMKNQNTSGIRASAHIDDTYASMLNLMTIEFVSFSKELKTLKADTEAQSRKKVIDMIQESFNQRDKLYGLKRDVARN